MGIVLLWATWAHKYMAILEDYGHRTSGRLKRAGGMWF